MPGRRYGAPALLPYDAEQNPTRGDFGMFGWRKRIGYITPTVMEVVPYEFYRFAPDGVGLVGVTCNIDDWGPEEFEKGLAQVKSTAGYLGSRGVDFIIHGGGPLVVKRGKGFEETIVNEIEVPAVVELAASEDDREIWRFFTSKFKMARPLALPPEVPAERVKALQDAFDTTMRDPQFLEEAKQIGLQIDPLGGEAIGRLIAQMQATPEALVERLRKLLAVK
jgi:hypothetical protein